MRLLDQDRMEERAVAMIARPLVDTQHAFDGVAAGYAASNEGNPLLRDMRARTLAAVFGRVPPGSHILDLGCGPGTDDEWLGRAGYRVTAIDWSPAMVEEAQRRIDSCGLGGRVVVHHVGIHQLDRLAGITFDAALSNFGPLNCVEDLARAAALISARIRPGGLLFASVIGRVCPWEVAVHLSRGDASRAFVRFARAPVPVPLEDGTVWTRYYSPDEFERAFAAAGFARVSLEALGLFAPPPYLEGFACRHPALVRRLQRLDERLGGRRPFRSWGDHFLIVLGKA